MSAKSRRAQRLDPAHPAPAPPPPPCLRYAIQKGDVGVLPPQHLGLCCPAVGRAAPGVLQPQVGEGGASACEAQGPRVQPAACNACLACLPFSQASRARGEPVHEPPPLSHAPAPTPTHPTQPPPPPLASPPPTNHPCQPKPPQTHLQVAVLGAPKGEVGEGDVQVLGGPLHSQDGQRAGRGGGPQRDPQRAAVARHAAEVGRMKHGIQVWDLPGRGRGLGRVEIG